jgi:hypothetical protein
MEEGQAIRVTLPGENHSEIGHFPLQTFFLLLRLCRRTHLTLIPPERAVGGLFAAVLAQPLLGFRVQKQRNRPGCGGWRLGFLQIATQVK